jgi:SCF-associated factor 1
MGKVDFTPDSAPLILPALQNKSIISVVIGDYHSGALTSSGKLLTWGEYSLGALGLGDPRKLKAGTPGGYATERQRSDAVLTQRRIIPPAVRSPIEVKFSHGRKSKDMFCFLAAAAGWHTGALVMDLNVSQRLLRLSLYFTISQPDVKDEEISENEVQAEFPEAGHILTHASPPFNPTVMPPTLSRGGFRIGFAGRGRGRRGRGG